MYIDTGCISSKTENNRKIPFHCHNVLNFFMFLANFFNFKFIFAYTSDKDFTFSTFKLIINKTHYHHSVFIILSRLLDGFVNIFSSF